MKNSLWLSTFAVSLSVCHVAGSPHLFRRQSETLTDGLPGWLWEATGLDTALETAHWFLNDFVFPTGWMPPTPSDVPDKDSTSRNDAKINLGADIELDTTVAPAEDIGDECKTAAWSDNQASIVSLIFWTSF